MSNNLIIQESQSTPLDISDSEAIELERLGKLLASKAEYWGDEEENDEKQDVEKYSIFYIKLRTAPKKVDRHKVFEGV